MSQQVINVGTVANDGTGDPLRTAFIKVNANFAELYGLMPTDSSGNLTPAAPNNSPHFTGDPQAPTPNAGDNDQSIATTNFVTSADNVLKADYDAKIALKANINAPVFTGDAQTTGPIPKTDNDLTIPNTAWVKANFAHVDPDALPPAGVDLSAYAPLASPHFTGIPTAPTAVAATNTDQLATTKFVQDVVLGIGTDNPDQIPPTLAKFLGTPPTGRLTLQSKQPIMTGNVTGAVSIYYVPYVGNTIPIYDGTDFVITRFTNEAVNIFELSANCNDSTHSPAPGGLQAGKVYDWFVWKDVTVPATPVIRLSRGPAWDDVKTRSSAGALTRIDGIWVNSNAISNGPAINKGTFVGTCYCATSNQLVWQWGGVNTRARFHVWNCYNRVSVGCTVVDNTYSYTVYSVDGEWNYMNMRQDNRIEAVIGLQDDAVSAVFGSVVQTDASTTAYVAIGFDWKLGDNAETGDPDHPAMYGWAYGAMTSNAFHNTIPDMGFHWWQAIERSDVGLSYTAYGYLANSYSSGISFNARM